MELFNYVPFVICRAVMRQHISCWESINTSFIDAHYHLITLIFEFAKPKRSEAVPLKVLIFNVFNPLFQRRVLSIMKINLDGTSMMPKVIDSILPLWTYLTRFLVPKGMHLEWFRKVCQLVQDPEFLEMLQNYITGRERNYKDVIPKNRVKGTRVRPEDTHWHNQSAYAEL